MKIIRSNRKSISLQMQLDGSIEVRAPLRATDAQIQDFLHRQSNWIEKHLQLIKERQEQVAQLTPFTHEEIQQMAKQALAVIPERVAHYAPLVGVTYGRITIRNQKSRWGSCSSQGNLNFNCLLMQTPPEVLDAVVVHELCHRKYMNHSQAFYAEVYRVFPEYDRWSKWLKAHGALLIQRMTG
jgi:hypothetical protein